MRAIYELEPHWENGGTSSFDVFVKGPLFDDTWNGTLTLRLTSCTADFDENGIVDTRDVLAFLNAWSAGDPRADINGDGAVDTLDVLAFLNSWAGGC